VPGCSAGGPTRPPSTSCPPRSVMIPWMAATVEGAIALASTYTPRNPVATTARARSTAAPGGQTLTTRSLLRQASARLPPSVRPAPSALARVAGERPSEAQTTVAPDRTRDAATVMPMAPGWRTATRPRGGWGLVAAMVPATLSGDRSGDGVADRCDRTPRDCCATLWTTTRSEAHWRRARRPSVAGRTGVAALEGGDCVHGDQWQRPSRLCPNAPVPSCRRVGPEHTVAAYPSGGRGRRRA
jgi:hypothetical protein